MNQEKCPGKSRGIFSDRKQLAVLTALLTAALLATLLTAALLTALARLLRLLTVTLATLLSALATLLSALIALLVLSVVIRIWHWSFLDWERERSGHLTQRSRRTFLCPLFDSRKAASTPLTHYAASA